MIDEGGGANTYFFHCMFIFSFDMALICIFLIFSPKTLHLFPENSRHSCCSNFSLNHHRFPISYIEISWNGGFPFLFRLSRAKTYHWAMQHLPCSMYRRWYISIKSCQVHVHFPKFWSDILSLTWQCFISGLRFLSPSYSRQHSNV